MDRRNFFGKIVGLLLGGGALAASGKITEKSKNNPILKVNGAILLIGKQQAIWLDPDDDKASSMSLEEAKRRYQNYSQSAEITSVA